MTNTISMKRNDGEMLFRAIFEQAAVGIARIVSKTGRFTEINQRYCDIVGYSRDEMEQRTFQEITHPSDLQFDLDNMERLMSGEIRRFSMEKRYLRKDGSTVWVNLTVSPMWEPGEEPSTHIAIVEDITKRKKAEEALCELNATLEQRVEERTAELAAANELLRKEIADREEAEERLRASEEMYSSIFTNIGIGISMISPEMEILFLNPVMRKWNPHVDVGKHPTCYRSFNTPPRDEVCPYCPTIDTLRDGKVHSSITDTPTPGGIRNFRVISAPLFSADGSISAVIEVVEDITEHMHAERELQRSNDLLRAIIEAAPTAIIGLDLDGKVQIVWNPAAEKMLGWSAHEVMGRPLPTVQAEDREEFRRLRERIHRGEAMDGVEVRRRRRDGTLIDYSIYASPLHDAQGGITGNVAVLVDITERKQVETRLYEQLHFLQQLLDSIPIPVYYKDVEGLYLGCNSAFERFIGLPRSELVGKTVFDLAPDDLADTYHAADMALFKESGVQVYETDVLHTDGTRHDVIFNKAAYIDSDGRVAGIVGAITDITEYRRAEAERKTLETQLQQALKMEAIGQLAGGIAHDFNNILTAIIGYSEIILLRMEKDSPLRRHAEQIFASAERAAELTNGLLAFSRKQALNTKPIDLCEVVRGLKKMLRRLVPEDIDFRTIASEKCLVVMADKGQIEQVLMNLVTNAKDAMPKGGVLTIEVFPASMDEKFVHAHGFGEPGNYACISVKDTGDGMDEETRKRIFEPFFTTKEVGKGTGLGMAIIYGIIRQHNGCIVVDSEPDSGTTFSVYLPLIAGEKMEADNTRISEPAAGGTETILLAEDDVTIRELHKMILEEAGYTVIAAFDGRDALDRFLEHQAEVDMLAADVIMPKINGKTLYEEIRKVRPDMKVLFMSGYTRDIVMERGILQDEISFMNKPVMSSELLIKVRKILDRN